MQNGPGISSAITITRAHAVLERLAASCAADAPPPDRSFPSMSPTVYPNALLNVVADRIDPKQYLKLLPKGACVVTLNITTPVLSPVLKCLAEVALAELDRQTR